MAMPFIHEMCYRPCGAAALAAQESQDGEAGSAMCPPILAQGWRKLQHLLTCQQFPLTGEGFASQAPAARVPSFWSTWVTLRVRLSCSRVNSPSQNMAKLL